MLSVTDTALEVVDLVKRYGERTAVEGLSFSVPTATVLALLGPNGAGKTTTVEIAEGFRKADSGAVRVLGLDPTNQAEAIGLIEEQLNLPGDIAAETYAIATDPVNGLARDAALDLAGFQTMLKLRAAFEGSAPSPAERYFDLSYRQRALATL